MEGKADGAASLLILFHQKPAEKSKTCGHVQHARTQAP